METLPSGTPFLPPTIHEPTIHFDLLTGAWPPSDKLEVPHNIIKRIKEEGCGSALTYNQDYLSLGKFYIEIELLVPHSTQRQVNQNHVGDLCISFGKVGILRAEHPGVVIGLGDGWYHMKKNTPKNIMITATSPHLKYLSATKNGPIGEIIKGGHRCAAMTFISKNYSKFTNKNFWDFEVLVPGMALFLLLLLSHILFFSLKKKKKKKKKSPTPFPMSFL